MSFSSASELETFEYATFTYILCDFWVPAADDPSTLRQNVTSPGGTTAAALGVLMSDDGLEALMTRAMTAARDRGLLAIVDAFLHPRLAEHVLGHAFAPLTPRFRTRERLAEVGDDPWPYGSRRVPTLVFAGVQFSGA